MKYKRVVIAILSINLALFAKVPIIQPMDVTKEAMDVVILPIDFDSDNDGITDVKEKELGLNPNSVDSDDDGINDKDEVGDIENPTDSDGDGVIDALDKDSDNDGISDEVEHSRGTDPKDSKSYPICENSEDEKKGKCKVAIAKEYDKTSYYVAYNSKDKTQYVLVMPSVKKVYVHKAGDIKNLTQVDSMFKSFPKYKDGNLCFSSLKSGIKAKHNENIMQNRCYDVNFFYTQKDKINNKISFILYYKPSLKVYEGLAGKKDTFKVVKDKKKLYNSRSITKEDYSKFKFDINSSKVIFYKK